MSDEHETEGEELPGVVAGQLCYLQIPALDPVASADFYARVFDWKVEHEFHSFEAPEMIGQWVTDRGPGSDAGMVLWIYVAELERTIGLALAAGGELEDPPADDGPRRLAAIRDPAGNRIGLAQHVG